MFMVREMRSPQKQSFSMSKFLVHQSSIISYAYEGKEYLEKEVMETQINCFNSLGH